ncbi:MAG TPA: hypothetical protein VFX33_07935 [Actinomycetales bacterium]|nr:hypothetical protein [Actinomycetales bacterium]
MNRRTLVTLVAVGAVTTGIVALGFGVRSTFGGQVAVDEPQYLISALSLWQDGDLDISNQLAAHAERPFHQAELPVQTEVLAGGRQVSPHDPLLPVLLAVPMGLGGWVAAKATLAVLAGLLAAVTTWLARTRWQVPPGVAAAVGLVAACTPPLVVYGQQVYPELAAALAVVVAVAAVTGRLAVPGTLVATIAVVALPWLAVKYAPVAAVLAVVLLFSLWRNGKRRTAGLVAATLAGAGVVFLLAHQLIYGGWTAYASGDHFQASGELSVVGLAPNYLGRSTRLIGLLVDRDFGLAAWQPAWLLLVPALAWLLHARPRQWQVLALPLAAGWLTATFVALTMHGYWWPGRQVVVVLPLAAVVVSVWLARLAPTARRWATAVAGVLALGGVAAYGWLVAAGWSVGRQPTLTWVSAPDQFAGPVHQALRGLLPDYREPGGGTWLRHGVWLAVLTALAVVGWRSARIGIQDERGPGQTDPAQPLAGFRGVRGPGGPDNPPEIAAPKELTRGTA